MVRGRPDYYAAWRESPGGGGNVSAEPIGSVSGAVYIGAGQENSAALSHIYGFSFAPENENITCFSGVSIKLTLTAGKVYEAKIYDDVPTAGIISAQILWRCRFTPPTTTTQVWTFNFPPLEAVRGRPYYFEIENITDTTKMTLYYNTAAIKFIDYAFYNNRTLLVANIQGSIIGNAISEFLWHSTNATAIGTSETTLSGTSIGIPAGFKQLTYVVKNVHGSQTLTIHIEGSRDNVNWFDLTATKVIAAGITDYLNTTDAMPYARLRIIASGANTGANNYGYQIIRY